MPITVIREKRKEQIVDFIRKCGIVSIKELAESLNLSAATIRKDVRELEENGLVSRHWGGVSLKEGQVKELSFDEKTIINLVEKKAIAQRAITLVAQNDTIGISAGTTAYEFARLLDQYPNVQVVTYGLNIAYLIARMGGKVVVPGGFLRDNSYALVGEDTVSFFKKIFLDKCFMGVDGLDIEAGLTDVNMAEAEVNRAMIESSGQLIIIADHTKLGQRKLVPIAPIDRIDVLITDSLADKGILKILEDKGIEVLIGEVGD